MAYINVKDWSVDQVTDWFKGLDNVIMQYNISFLNNGVTGHQLLNLRADDLEHLGVKSLGHQEIILEAVEQLRYFHFELDKENLQLLALKLSCVSNSLYKELLLIDDDCTTVHTQVMADVHNIISTIKPLVYWLDRSPFVGDNEYIDSKINLLQLSFEMATSAHRGIFSEKPIRTIRSICEKLSKIADHIIQEIMDPMILQPASLDLATLKKKEQELGFFILPNNNAIHQIADIKHGSPAHGSSKIEEGDEIVQVNYQTVVGWQRKKVMMLLQESPPEIVLTLKKRPRHTKVYGQIYMKPYRLPSKKRNDQNWSSRWYDNIPSPRLLTMDLPPITITRIDNKVEVPDVETELSSSDSEPPDSPLDTNSRMYPLKPRPILQRRNTITGSTPTNKRPYPSIEQYWNFIKSQASETHSSTTAIISKFEEDSQFLRDKSASCTVGLDLSPRPITVIGLSRNNSKQDQPSSQKSKRKVNFEIEKKLEPQPISNLEEKSVSINSLASLNNEEIGFIDEGRELTDRTSMTPEEDLSKKKEPIFTDVRVHDMIKRFDEKNNHKPKTLPKSQSKKPPEVPQKPAKPAVPPRKTPPRGKLDKSHSTPAYDLSEDKDTNEDNGDEVPVKQGSVVEAINPFVTVGRSSIPPKPPPRNLTDTAKLGGGTVRTYTTNTMVKSTIEPIKVNPGTPTRNMMESKAIPTTPITKTEPPKPPSIPNQSTPKNHQSRNENLVVIAETDNVFQYPEVKDELSVSTPVTKTKLEPESETPSYKSSAMYEIHKIVSEVKSSPTNSMVKAMIKGKSSTKKKNTLITKRRKVSVNELSPLAEIQGHLFQRLRYKQTQNVHWEKRWFMLSGNCLYGFRSRDSPRAACLIFLSGFTVAVASEVKSRSNAFKVYHTGTVFYFSADDQDALQSWIDLIRQATLHNTDSKHQDSELYSETDDSDTEKLKSTQDSSTTTTTTTFGSLRKYSKKSDGSTSLDRKWFFNKSGSQGKNSLPVPTSQFRSYRKIVPSVENPVQSSVTTGNFTSHVSLFNNPSVPNLAMEVPKSTTGLSGKKHVDSSVHASNPILSCSIDLGNNTHFKHSNNENLSGFVTLEELMIRQTEERKMNPHYIVEEVTKNLQLAKSDVVYGEVPLRQKPPQENPLKPSKSSVSLQERDTGTSSCFGKRLGSLKKSQDKTQEDYTSKTATYPKIAKGTSNKITRSLPRAHRVQDDKTEMIYCPEKINDIHYAHNRTLEDTKLYEKGVKLRKQPSFSEKGEEKRAKLKPTFQYTPMSIPLAGDPKSKPKFAFELNLDENKTQKGSKLKQIFAGKSSEGKKGFLGSPKFKSKKQSNSKSEWANATTQVANPDNSATPENSSPVIPEPFSNIPQVEYPGLEYPPVFEPETYSLANPQSNIIRRQGSK